MHGVKRLFAWMIPRFDKSRFNVSLISLRRGSVADTLEEFGIDVTYMARHKFDPATFPALLKVLRAKRADIVHLHGYGATTFGRMCAWRMGIPAILHEHANHGDTPWFQKSPLPADAGYRYRRFRAVRRRDTRAAGAAAPPRTRRRRAHRRRARHTARTPAAARCAARGWRGRRRASTPTRAPVATLPRPLGAPLSNARAIRFDKDRTFLDTPFRL